VVVAAGSRPPGLGIPGAEYAITSERFLELDHLPGRILFIGGGYMAFEFAQVAARAGARVTILHRGERPLERFDLTWWIDSLRGPVTSGLMCSSGRKW